MQKYSARFEDMTGFKGEEFTSYVDKMRTNMEWGTTNELLAFSTMCSVIVSSYCKDRWAAYRPQFTIGSNGETYGNFNNTI
jgi:hypothetical protein